MVKIKCVLLSLLLTNFCAAQNISLGIGGSLLLNQLEHSENITFDLKNVNGESLILKADKVTLEPIYSFPIFIRYESKKNWWVQLAYGFEYWRMNMEGQTMMNPAYIENQTQTSLQSSWQNYAGSQYPDFASYSTAFHPTFYAQEKALNTREFEYFDAMQYNKFTLSFGSVLFKKSRYKIVYGIGLDFISKNTSESYHGLIYEDPFLIKQFEFLQALPALLEFNFAPSFSLGFEKQNLRIGIEGHLFNKPAITDLEGANSNVILEKSDADPTIKNVLSVGLYLNYSLFTHYLDSKLKQGRFDELKPQILDEHYEKPNTWQFGITADFISLVNTSFTNPSQFELSEEDHLKIDQALTANNDNYITGLAVTDYEAIDNIYIEKKYTELNVNDLGQIDTVNISKLLFFNWGTLNTIIKSPKISGFVRFSPFKSIFFESALGFQTQTMGVESYEKVEREIGSNKSTSVREILYQERFNELSLSAQAFGTKRILKTSKIGANVGLVFNHWIPGKFTREAGGKNDSELLKDFHDYFIQNQGSEEWNNQLNSEADKGVFSKQDYYDSFMNNEEKYHRDFSDQLLNSFSKRSFIEIRFGLDYYIEKWRFSVYGEKSFWQKSTFYNESFQLGVAISRSL
jgi:hypothetical protein